MFCGFFLSLPHHSLVQPVEWRLDVTPGSHGSSVLCVSILYQKSLETLLYFKCEILFIHAFLFSQNLIC